MPVRLALYSSVPFYLRPLGKLRIWGVFPTQPTWHLPSSHRISGCSQFLDPACSVDSVHCAIFLFILRQTLRIVSRLYWKIAPVLSLCLLLHFLELLREEHFCTTHGTVQASWSECNALLYHTILFTISITKKCLQQPQTPKHSWLNLKLARPKNQHFRWKSS